MIPIICVDDQMGMLFNARRVSRDSTLYDWIVNYTKDHKLWITDFSKDLFPGETVLIDEECLSKAGDNDYCFIENQKILPYMKRISRILICKWNRRYPSDFKLELGGNIWTSQILDEFAGSSHDKITVEEIMKK